MKPSTHQHPNPTLSRIIQYGAIIVAALMVISAPLQALLTLAGAPGGGFILSAIFTVILAGPVVMLTAVAPPVSINQEGITLHPVVWKERFIPWGEVAAVKVFPLLPTVDTEVNRRWLVGRKNYTPADGLMLVIPSLPLQYRIVGFFAGVRAQPVIAVTNRAHTDYEKLAKAILNQTNPEIHDLDEEE